MPSEAPRTLGSRLVRRAILMSARWSRSMLLGVRGVVVDPEGRVFLVRHTYVAGWHFPGGGVEVGETLLQSLERELSEEGNIRLAGAAQLHGVFFNPRLGNRDHVAVFVVRDFTQSKPKAPDHEIAESGFFPLDRLPPAATSSVRARLEEIFEGRTPTHIW